jgi:excisionase family DNA binding protein
MSAQRTIEDLTQQLAGLIEQIAERVYERKEAERRVLEPAAPDRDEELTVKDVARIKKVAPRTVYDWVATDRIKFHHTPGGQLRFYRKHLDVIQSAP